MVGAGERRPSEPFDGFRGSTDRGGSVSAIERAPVGGEKQSNARLLTAEQLADRWQVSKAQVYRLARESRIPAVAIGRYYRFREAAIEAWEASQEV